MNGLNGLEMIKELSDSVLPWESIDSHVRYGTLIKAEKVERKIGDEICIRTEHAVDSAELFNKLSHEDQKNYIKGITTQ